ncbi:MAG: hypothetical protein MZW92_40840 [Comamonadaceae bacterium]|nr:hypothetical protein [Comamonadaceae bacterium]
MTTCRKHWPRSPRSRSAVSRQLGQEFDLLASDFATPAVLPGATSRLGALHVKVAEFDPPIANVFLVKAEIEYTANRLGRALP